MDLRALTVPPVLDESARLADLGAYRGGARTPLAIPWLGLIVPVILVVTGALAAVGVIEMETRRGEVESGTLVLGMVLGGVALIGIAVWVVRQPRGSIYFYERGFAIDHQGSSGVILTYQWLVAHQVRDQKNRPAYVVRNPQHQDWIPVPRVRGIDRIGPEIMRYAQPAESADPHPPG